MSDPVIPMLKRTLEYFEGKRQAIDAVITHLNQTIALLEDDSVLAPKELPAAKEQAAKKKARSNSQKTPRPGKWKTQKPPRIAGGKQPYTRDDVVAVALGLIRAEGPQKARRITTEVLDRFAVTGTGVASHLSYEASRGAKAQLVRTKDGLYDRRSTAKSVDVNRSPEEMERVMAAARKNKDNAITSEIRA